MKTLKLLFLFFLILTSDIFGEEPFFEYIGDPNGGRTTKLEISESGTLYLGTYNGLFKSTNCGKNWIQIFQFGQVLNFSVLNDSIIALSSGYSGQGDLYISYNGGGNWLNKKEIVYCSLQHEMPQEIIFDKNGNLLLECYEDEQITMFLSKDFGNSFKQKIITFDSVATLVSVAITLTRILNGKLFCILNILKRNGIEKHYISIIDSNLNINKLIEYSNSIYCWEVFNDSTFIIGEEGGIFFTGNRGQTWEPTNINEPIISLTKLAENEFLALSRTTVYYSKNNWGTWESIYPIIQTKQEFFYFNRIYHGNCDTVFAIGGGFFISTDKGFTWKRAEEGLNSVYIRDMAFDDKNIYSATYSGLFKSSDNGNSWELTGFSGNLITCLAINSKNEIFVSSDAQRIGIAKSTDEGKNWKISKEGLIDWSGEPTIISDLFINTKGYILAGQAGGSELYISKDDGETWNIKDDMVGSLCFALNNQGYLFGSGGTYGKLIITMSKDGGESWETVLFDVSNRGCTEGLTRINFLKSKPYGYSFCYYMSSDNGLSWSSDPYGSTKSIFFIDSLENCYSLDTDYNNNWKLYIIRSSNYGTTWDTLNSGVIYTYQSNPFTRAFVSPNGYIFLAFENGGLYRSRDRFVSVKEEPKQEDKLLSSPNPATDFLEIFVGVRHAEPLQNIEIFSVLGTRLLTTPVNLTPTLSMLGEGVRIDVSSLPTGIYFVKVGTQVGKFMKL